MSSLAQKRIIEDGKQETRGRRHFQHVHRKTSLFGSENEEQNETLDTCPRSLKFDSNGNHSNNEKEISMSETTFSRKLQHGLHEESESNGNSADEQIGLLIEAAKARAEQRDSNKNGRKLLPDDSHLTENKSIDRQIRATLQAPWYTDTNENNLMKRSNSRGKPQRSPTKTISLMNKSTSQMDFPEYSKKELQESRPQQKRFEHRESVPWYPESVGNNGQEEQCSQYKRSSDVIGESFIDKFGIEQNPNGCQLSKIKSKQPSPVAASSMHNTPYAQHN